jgi:hypothetical protein
MKGDVAGEKWVPGSASMGGRQMEKEENASESMGGSSLGRGDGLGDSLGDSLGEWTDEKMAAGAKHCVPYCLFNLTAGLCVFAGCI